jgi:crotonobetainyl-CoA:carnitine CoA-transferase CaiB-like acyl-CoA transferase
VCQTSEDRCDFDPQLAAREWMTEVTGLKIGTWPTPAVPVKASATPPFVGGEIDRAAPVYGQDNEYVYGEMLGMSSAEMAQLVEDDVI